MGGRGDQRHGSYCCVAGLRRVRSGYVDLSCIRLGSFTIDLTW